MGTFKTNSNSPIVYKLKHLILSVLLIILVISITYSPLMTAGFVWDDDEFLVEWKTIQQLKNWPQMIKGDLPQGHTGVYRPLRTIAQAISYQLYKTNPRPYHIQAISIHIIGTLLCFGICLLLMKKLCSRFRIETIPSYGIVILCTLTSLFFGLHPVQTEAIAFITASFDTLGLVISLGAFFLYLLYRDLCDSHKNLGLIVLLLSFVATTIAFFTTELSLSLLPLFFVTEILWFHKPFIKTVLRLLPVILLFILFLHFRGTFVTQSTRTTGYLNNSPYYTFLAMTKVTAIYAERIIFPHRLSPVIRIAPGITNLLAEPDAVAIQQITDTKTLIGIVVLTIATTLFILLFIYDKTRLGMLGLALFISGISPVSNIIPGGAFFAERYLYIGMLGISVFVLFGMVYGITSLQNKTSMIKGILIGLMTTILLIYAYRTFLRTLDWQNNILLWTTAAITTPHDSGILNNLGLALGNVGNLKLAFRAFSDSQQASKGKNPRPFFNQSLVLKDLKRVDEAKQQALSAYLISPKTPEYIINYATILSENNKPTEAEMFLATQSAILSNNPNYWFLLGNISIRANNMGTAEDALKEVLNLDPNNIKAAINLGAVYNSVGKPTETIALLEPYKEKGTILPDLYYNLAVAYEKINNKSMARLTISTGKQLSPTDDTIAAMYDRLFRSTDFQE